MVVRGGEGRGGLGEFDIWEGEMLEGLEGVEDFVVWVWGEELNGLVKGDLE